MWYSSGLPLAELWGGRVRERVALKFVVSGPPERAGAERAAHHLGAAGAYVQAKDEGAGDNGGEVHAQKREDEEYPVDLDEGRGSAEELDVARPVASSGWFRLVVTVSKSQLDMRP